MSVYRLINRQGRKLKKSKRLTDKQRMKAEDIAMIRHACKMHGSGNVLSALQRIKIMRKNSYK